MYGDRNGNVYQRGDNGDWSQRNGNQWNQSDQRNNMNRDYESRQRSSNQNAGFQQMNRGGGGFGGGGARGGGGLVVIDYGGFGRHSWKAMSVGCVRTHHDVVG